MKRLRILQLITELAPAGAERCVYELACRLDRDQFDVRVAALRGGAVADWLAEAGVAVTVLGVRGKWDVGKLGRLVRMLRRERIDILHTHLFHADLAGRLAAWLAGRVRVVHTVHIAETRFRPWQFAFYRLTAGLCDRLIAVSGSAGDYHASRCGLPPSRYTVIPNGIDIAAYSRCAQARAALRAEWGVGPDEVLAAFVGRLDYQKGLDTLLAAMSSLHSQGRAPKLVIAGQGPQQGMLEKFLAAEPAGRRIRLLGFTNDVRGVLSAADLLAMPSRWEGFGLAAAEAMAASLPVVATNAAGLRDVVVPGRTALVVDKDDPKALAGAIEQLSADAALRKRLGQAGRRRAVERFDINTTIAAHEALYRQIAGQISQPRP